MQKYLAVVSIVLLIIMIMVRVSMLKKLGIQAVKFGKIDKKDFILPPFMLFYFYLITAHTFNLPTIPHQEIFHHEIAAWIGVFLCFTGLILLFWSLLSFRRSFRIGIDLNHSEGLITDGIFAFSRNPIYICFALVLTGQFLIFSSWILLVYLVGVVLIVHRQVLLEEDFLKKKYGTEYLEYCKRVRRYL